MKIKIDYEYSSPGSEHTKTSHFLEMDKLPSKEEAEVIIRKLFSGNFWRLHEVTEVIKIPE